MDVLRYKSVVVTCSLEYRITYRIKLLLMDSAIMVKVNESLDHRVGSSGHLSNSIGQAVLPTLNGTFKDGQALD